MGFMYIRPESYIVLWTSVWIIPCILTLLWYFWQGLHPCELSLQPHSLVLRRLVHQVHWKPGLYWITQKLIWDSCICFQKDVVTRTNSTPTWVYKNKKIKPVKHWFESTGNQPGEDSDPLEEKPRQGPAFFLSRGNEAESPQRQRLLKITSQSAEREQLHGRPLGEVTYEEVT